MPSYHDVLWKALRRVEGSEVSGEAVQLLMLGLCRMDHTDLYNHYHDEMPPQQQAAFEAGVARLQNDEPLAYILGWQEFYGYPIKVDPRVLIPRYETEELVANVLADTDHYFPGNGPLDLADVATGSGAIAIALGKEEPRYRLKATDISVEALDLARSNARELNVPIEFYQGDMLQPLIDHQVMLDILVCNPPYIPQSQPVQASVAKYEPPVALYGGTDGLRFYRSLFSQARRVLKPRSFIACEIGWDEKPAILKLAGEALPEFRAEVLKDLNGKDRMLFLYHDLPE